MAIVNNVVTAHHGKVKLETSDKGTHFLAQLPQFARHELINPVRQEPDLAVKALAAAMVLK
ncbi:MAG: hypothetical protein LV479_10055 [Methylacidiphilales bacterium]|nr:hypothetical protein [Candidatus Methylacidiphilales bacterium]